MSKKVPQDIEFDDKEKIRPITEKEEHKMSERFSQISIVMQSILNALQRQSLTNLATAAIYKDRKFTTNFSSLTNGLSSRLAYQGFAIYPALQIRKVLIENNLPQFSINFATTFTDTFLGVPLEVNSSLKTLKLLGVNIAKKDLLTVSTRTFFPFFVRNGLSWCAINSNSQESLLSKIAYGAAAGIISTPFNNIGIKVIEHSPNKTWQETWEAVLKEITKQPNLFRGVHLRASSIAASSILLAPQTTAYLTGKFSEVFIENIPSKCPKPESSIKIIISDNKRNSNLK
jgi:hypothetical protein